MGKVIPIRKSTEKPKTSFRGIYPSYAFKDHDPVLDHIDTLRKDVNMSFEDLSVKSGVSISTLNNWYIRKTKRPQHATVAAVVNAMGGRLVITRHGKEIKK